MFSSCLSNSKSRQCQLSGAENTTFAPHMVLATSSSVAREHLDLMYNRQLCADRRGFFDHLAPNRIVYNTFRVSMSQVMQVSSSYWNDELKGTMERDKKVNEGTLTQWEADKEGEDWAKREWAKRWENINTKIFVALAKYHAITVVMRVYEIVSESLVDIVTLDKLTLDMVEHAKRGSSKDRNSLSQEMISVSFSANVIYYLADFSVHFAILMYGYVKLVQDRQRKKLENGIAKPTEALDYETLALSCLKKTTLLAFSRGVELGLGSLGGGFGTMIKPGLGSLAGFNLGDSIAIGLTDSFVSLSPE